MSRPAEGLEAKAKAEKKHKKRNHEIKSGISRHVALPVVRSSTISESSTANRYTNLRVPTNQLNASKLYCLLRVYQLIN